MKKILLTSALAICMAVPSYSTTVSGSGNECNEPILGTDTGPATLRATWDANTININWYSDNTKITPTNNTANTCTYDSVITLPTNTMNKTGYTFGGWRVKSMGFDITTLSQYASSPNGTGYAFIKFDGTGSTVSGTRRKTPDAYNLTNNGEWAAEFSYGTIKGMARCSPVGSSYSQGQNGEPIGNTGSYCWCKVTGYDAEKDGSYLSPVASLWAFYNGNVTAANCASDCTYGCGNAARTYGTLRVGLYANPQ